MAKNLKELFGTHHGLDDKSVDFLTKALEKNNLPGFDYIEFKQSLAALSGMNMDETTAMKSAFATASTVGLTKEKLLKTANHYKQVLNNEKTAFDNALQNQVTQRIAGKQGEVEKLKKQIAEYKAKIEQLEAHIKKSQATIDNADSHIEEAKSKINSTKTGFEHTYQSILNQIDKDIESINNLL